MPLLQFPAGLAKPCKKYKQGNPAQCSCPAYAEVNTRMPGLIAPGLGISHNGQAKYNCQPGNRQPDMKIHKGLKEVRADNRQCPGHKGKLQGIH